MRRRALVPNRLVYFPCVNLFSAATALLLLLPLQQCIAQHAPVHHPSLHGRLYRL